MGLKLSTGDSVCILYERAGETRVKVMTADELRESLRLPDVQAFQIFRVQDPEAGKDVARAQTPD